MLLTIDYSGLKYSYSKEGDFATWKDENGLVIPLMLHTILREKALLEGADSNIFLTNGIVIVPNVKKVKKTVSVGSKKSVKNKKNLVGGFNPFS